MSEAAKEQKPEGWTFQIDEISNGCWRVRGVHVDGRSVERHGSDLDTLMVESIKDAEGLGKRRYSPRV